MRTITQSQEVFAKAKVELFTGQEPKKSRFRILFGSVATVALGATVASWSAHSKTEPESLASSSPPVIQVSSPLERSLDSRLQFLGQFSAVKRVELRAQVGGTLTRIGFKDGGMVREGDLLFEIDPTPYEIKLNQATAQLKSARARLELATRELERANDLKRSNANSVQDVDQRVAEKHAAQASVEEAEALIRDAKFDLDHCRITAPFTGQIGSHLVSVGNLVAGSRAAGSASTLLATIVSLDPIYLDFDMSEADYMKFARQREGGKGAITDKISLSISDENSFSREGTLDFVDNVIDRSSGTMRARATVPNRDLLLTPGGFGRVRLAVSAPRPMLLVPDASVIPDQSDHVVLTVDQDNVVKAKQVEVGDLRGGLRVIRSGLAMNDKVVVEGMPIAAPGSKITPANGKIEFKNDQE